MERPLTGHGLRGLEADVYQLVLAAVYHADGLWGEASFDLYARELPSDHGYLVVAGIEEAVDAALGLEFGPEALDWLERQEFFRRAASSWWESLRHLRFDGDILAVPEGEIVFPGGADPPDPGAAHPVHLARDAPHPGHLSRHRRGDPGLAPGRGSLRAPAL